MITPEGHLESTATMNDGRQLRCRRHDRRAECDQFLCDLQFGRQSRIALRGLILATTSAGPSQATVLFVDRRSTGPFTASPRSRATSTALEIAAWTFTEFELMVSGISSSPSRKTERAACSSDERDRGHKATRLEPL